MTLAVVQPVLDDVGLRSEVTEPHVVATLAEQVAVDPTQCRAGVMAKPAHTHDGPEGGGRTFIETARRAQIVQAAIDTIADLGYANASYAQIAKRAGLSSTGLISYHFHSKDDLIEQVIAELVAA